MPNNQFINLEELSKTTQALLSKINEQSNLKVNKHNVKAELETGTKIGSIEGIEFYAPEEIDTSNFITWNDDLGLATVAYTNDYNNLNNRPTLATVATTGSYNDLNNKPTIPNVPNWALQSTKPTYTASEVGALTKDSADNLYLSKGRASDMIGNSTNDTLRLGYAHSTDGQEGRLQLSNAPLLVYQLIFHQPKVLLLLPLKFQPHKFKVTGMLQVVWA